MNEPFFKLVLQGKELPSAFDRYKIQWEVDHEGKTLAEYIGVTEYDIHDLLEVRHSFEFIFLRCIHRKHSLDRVFPGIYVQFIAEYDDMRPHFEYGWIDSFDEKKQSARLQCDDTCSGNRSLEINIRDILQILPTKERPNIFFKAMLCKECKDCSHESGEFIEECPFFSLFSSIKRNRIQSRQTVGKFLGYGKTEDC